MQGLHLVHTAADEDGGLSQKLDDTHLFSGSYVQYCRVIQLVFSLDEVIPFLFLRLLGFQFTLEII